MGLPVLILLAVVWAAVLLPPFLRQRSEGRPGRSVSSFTQHLAVLGRTRPGSPRSSAPAPSALTAGPGMPHGRSGARRRRLNVLCTLAAAVGFTLLLAVALGGPAVLVHLVADAVLGGYLFLLVQLRKDAAERTAKVRYLPVERSSAPALVTLRRSASS